MKSLLTILFLITSIFLFADGVQPSGSGTQMYPYQVFSLDNLLWISTNESIWDDGLYFVQMADIDASPTQNWNNGAGFSSIGRCQAPQLEDYPFVGNYNGNNYSIENLYINRPDSIGVGLFGYAWATISDLNVYNTSINGSDYTGSVVGRAENMSSLINLHCSGIVNGNNCVGGLIGDTDNTVVSNCTSQTTVNGNSSVGGLIGFGGDSEITDVSTQCTITGDTGIGGIVGGLTSTSISNSTSNSTLSSNYFVGGIVGLHNFSVVIYNCYYNYESNLINGEQLITTGALSESMYLDWQVNNYQINIDDYLTSSNGCYLINTEDDFEKMSAFSFNQNNSYRLTADLELSDRPNTYIPYFSGTFYGDDHTIEGLTINALAISNAGLFGQSKDALIESIHLINASVESHSNIGMLVSSGYNTVINDVSCTGDVTGIGNQVGGVVGYAFNLDLNNSHSAGSVSGYDKVGGLVGLQWGGDVSECSSSSQTIGAYRYTGGLIGKIEYDVHVSESFVTGDVSGYDYTGGFIGSASFSTVSNCYSKGNVNGNTCVGGFTGVSSSIVSKSYSTGSVTGDFEIGGFAGVCGGSVSNCVWDIESSGTIDGVGGDDPSQMTLYGFTTQQMQQETSFADLGWDFVDEDDNGTLDNWDIDVSLNEGYPYLSWQEFDTTPNEDVSTPINDLSYLNSAYPNPFNPETTIEFNVKQGESGTLTIYNIKGQTIKRYPMFTSGKQNIVWDGIDNNGKSVSSGVYFYRLKTQSINVVKKVILMK